MTPRSYLSYSQMTTIHKSPKAYADTYIYGLKQRISRNMQYGSMMAEGLESEEATGDPMLDMMMAKIPKFEIMDKPVVDTKHGIEIENPHDGKTYKIPILKGQTQNIPLLAVPDTAKADYSAFKEYKTSVRKWTQKMADESGQITFYATAIWIVTGKIPEDIELVNVCVEYDQDGRLQPTGEILRFKTKRTMVDIIKMTGQIRRTWEEIKKLCVAELTS